ncbi:hypothetical protein LCGC14_0289190 [marine sediment metagenome]|uniref:Uncharacterized protein n=1 Tax=marine sediment metagenome TaxID=412755 RepID=A0A0F9UAR8_9ZZZZ
MALTVDELRDEMSHHLQDPARLLVNDDQLLEFINSAAWDAANEGWVVDLDETESTTLSSGTYAYDVPASFVYVHELIVADAAGDYPLSQLIPWSKWQIVMNGATVQFLLSKDRFTITDGRAVKVRGQARPTAEYSADGSIDAGMESFIRERAIMYAARNLSRHSGGHAQQYAQLMVEAKATSDELFTRQAELFQPKTMSRVVPSR